MPQMVPCHLTQNGSMGCGYDVRFGSKADIDGATTDVRFVPISTKVRHSKKFSGLALEVHIASGDSTAEPSRMRRV